MAASTISMPSMIPRGLFKALMPFPLPAPMHVAEAKDGFEITLDAPGFAPENISVNVWRRTVTVRGRNGGAAGDEAFERQFALPANADEDAVAASLVDGTLTLTIPKKLVGVAAVVASRMVPVSSAAVGAASPTALKAVAATKVSPRPADPKAALAELAAAVKAGDVKVSIGDESVTFSFKK